MLNFNQKRAKVAIPNFQEDVIDINLDEIFPLRINHACAMHVFEVFLYISFYEFTLGIKQSIAILHYCLSIFIIYNIIFKLKLDNCMLYYNSLKLWFSNSSLIQTKEWSIITHSDWIWVVTTLVSIYTSLVHL